MPRNLLKDGVAAVVDGLLIPIICIVVVVVSALVLNHRRSKNFH